MRPGTPAIPGADAVPIETILTRLAKDASDFWATAPRYVAEETWRESSTITPERQKRHLRIGAAATKKPVDTTVIRQLVSYYAFGAFRHGPEALFEFRHIISVDGKAKGDPDRELKKFEAGLHEKSDHWRHKAREDFEMQTMSGVVVDFGQLIMLFTKRRQQQYDYKLNGTERLGADIALRVDFEQRQGKQGLHISDPGQEPENTPLRGQILVRRGDLGVLQIRLSASRKEKAIEVRDEGQVDYFRNAAGALLPTSVVHRRYEDKKLIYEDSFQYSNWRLMEDSPAA